MAMCVRSLAVVRNLHHVPQLSRLSKVGHAMEFVRIQPPNGNCWAIKRGGGPLVRTHVAALATMTTGQELESVGIFYADAGINRAAEMRVDASKLSCAFNSPEALVVPLMGSQNLVKEGKPVLIAASMLQMKDADHASAGAPVFLGLSNSTQAPVFAVNVAEISSAGGERPVWEGDSEWVDVRRFGPQLQALDAGLLAYARGMVEWQSRNIHCGRCGTRMVAKDGGHSLHCSSDSCKNSAYPRLDPAVIMLITCGDYVLLGRQSRWNPGRYSLLAGFVEIGETFEMAVAREVKEEAGINVDVTSVSYAASQPWPFPSSLMVGFYASAVKNQCEPYSGNNNAIPVTPQVCAVVDEVNALPRTVVDNKELEDARWVHKEILRWVLHENPLPHGVEFSVPGKYAIANVLLSRWAARSSNCPWAGDNIKSVEISQGIFKYVLMCISDNDGHDKLIVRGNENHAYHSDILEATQKEVCDAGFKVRQLGGGRIEHDPEQRKLHVFSISQAYGPADHTVTCALLKQWFPLHSITFSWGG